MMHRGFVSVCAWVTCVCALVTIYLGMIRQDSNYCTSGQTSQTSTALHCLQTHTHMHVCAFLSLLCDPRRPKTAKTLSHFMGRYRMMEGGLRCDIFFQRVHSSWCHLLTHLTFQLRGPLGALNKQLGVFPDLSDVLKKELFLQPCGFRETMCISVENL